MNNVLEALLKIAKANHYLVSFPSGMMVSYDTFSAVEQMLITMENSKKIRGKYAENCFTVLKILENMYTDHSVRVDDTPV